MDAESKTWLQEKIGALPQTGGRTLFLAAPRLEIKPILSDFGRHITTPLMGLSREENSTCLCTGCFRITVKSKTRSIGPLFH